ncbi:MAG: LPS assembly protein LptD [Candidatus Omnitrophota bacterium]
MIRRTNILFFTCLCAFIFSAARAFAEGAVPVEVSGDQVEYFEAEKKVVGTGKVLVTYKDIKMTCDKVTAFLEEKEAIAEGNVVVTKGGDILQGEKVIYDFQEETGTIVNGFVKSGPWYAGSSEIKKVSRDEVDIEKGYLTTCDLEKPHYRIQARQIKVFLGDRVEAKNVTVFAGPVPVFFSPVYSQSVTDSYPSVSLVPGHNKDWGGYLLSAARYDLGNDRKGNIHVDYRQRKGFAEGVDYSFKSENLGQGYARLYYMDERDSVKKTEIERWRAKFRHKWDINPTTVWTAEYNRMSDRDFLKNYFYREEFERDPEPESYISVINYQPNFSTRVLTKKRVNRFFTEVERLPEVTWESRNYRIFEKLPFFYKGDMTASSLDKRFANSGDNLDVMRIDSYNQLSYPFRAIKLLSIDPYVGFRDTYYSREKDSDEDRYRKALCYGVDMSTSFFKAFDYSTNAFGLDVNGLRHILTPNAGFYYVQKPSFLPERLNNFDAVDALDQERGIALTLENKLQTKRGKNKETVELARFIVGTDYLLHLSDGDRFGDVDTELELRPNDWLYIKNEAIYDPKWKDLKTINTDFVATGKDEKWRLGLGHRYEEKFSSQLTSQLEATLTPKWKCRVYERYELRGNDFREQEYAVTRDLHCWEAEVAYNKRDAHTVWVIFRLKAFPDMPLKLGTSYHDPKTSRNQ